MNIIQRIALAIAVSLSIGSVAQAQDWQRGDGSRAEQRYEQQQQQRRDRIEDRIDRREDRRRAERRADRREDRRQDARRYDPRYPSAVVRQDDRWDHRDPRWNQRWSRGAGPGHDLYRGGRLPPQYRRYDRVVDNWQGHHLRQPPSGYHWVQAGGDYVLAAIATGAILSIILSN